MTRIIKASKGYYRIFLLHSIIPLLFGTTIYLLFRGLYIIDPTKKFFPLFSTTQIPNWIKYNLPDGLWFYALLSTLIFIWGGNFSRHLILWLLLAVITSISTEVMQAYHFIPGTFDLYDLIAYIIATDFSYFNFQYKKYSLKKFKSNKQ